MGTFKPSIDTLLYRTEIINLQYIFYEVKYLLVVNLPIEKAIKEVVNEI